MPTSNYELSHSGIATLTLNRDDKRNAIDAEMSRQLLQSMEQAVADQARVIVLRGNPGVDVWCAGHDLGELDPNHLETENTTLELCRRVQSLPLPVIAMVEGSVHGGGLILLLAADIVVAASNATVSFTAGKLGIPLPPQWYALWLSVMGLHHAKELLFTSAAISAADAHAAGLYNHVVAVEELAQVTYKIAEQIALGATEAIARMKSHLNLLARQTALSDEALGVLQAENQDLLSSPQTKDRISALLESLRP